MPSFLTPVTSVNYLSPSDANIPSSIVNIVQSIRNQPPSITNVIQSIRNQSPSITNQSPSITNTIQSMNNEQNNVDFPTHYQSTETTIQLSDNQSSSFSCLCCALFILLLPLLIGLEIQQILRSGFQ